MKPPFVLLQPWLPQHLISRIVGWAARSKWPPLKQLLINRVRAWYNIELRDYEIEDANQFESFNHFFTRALKKTARPIAADPLQVACPVDGTVSQLGSISGAQIFQAKGRYYSTESLLGNAEQSQQFNHGHFATLYLAPNNYHRIHMPVNGKLTSMRYVPGRLFSVNTASATHIDQVFARNERVIAQFDTDFGKMAMVLVGALNVGSIETVHEGLIAPNSHKKLHDWNYAESIAFEKGQEFGRFNLGSTVILLFSGDAMHWQDTLQEHSTLRMGMPIGQKN